MWTQNKLYAAEFGTESSSSLFLASDEFILSPILLNICKQTAWEALLNLQTSWTDLGTQLWHPTLSGCDHCHSKADITMNANKRQFKYHLQNSFSSIQVQEIITWDQKKKKNKKIAYSFQSIGWNRVVLQIEVIHCMYLGTQTSS